MTTDCQVSGENTELLYRDMANITFSIGGGWSGSNFAISSQALAFYGAPAASFIFRAVGAEPDSTETTTTLSTANCTVYMNYVEQDVRCAGRSCRTVRARAAPAPASHIPSIYDDRPIKANLTEYSPLSGLAQNDTMVTQFFKNFVNATNPSQACDTVSCPMSGVEGYLTDPNNPFNVQGTPPIANLGNEVVSLRMAQLVNTYWLNSIAPYSLTGNFSGVGGDVNNLAFRYNTDSIIGTRETSQKVVKVHLAWMAILIITASVMMGCGIYTVVLTMRRRGPDILDNFSALLRNNPYVEDPGYHSMDDAADQALRLKNTVVRLGDVRPQDEIGHIAIASSGSGFNVRPLSVKRMYH